MSTASRAAAAVSWGMEKGIASGAAFSASTAATVSSTGDFAPPP